MKPKEHLKRLYYALTSGALLIAVFVLLSSLLSPFPLYTQFYTTHPIKSVAIVMAIALVFCWIMSQHNNRHDGLMFCGIILLTFIFTLTGHLMTVWRYNHTLYSHTYWFWMTVKYTMPYVCGACMAAVGFRSNTKYHNILPNQSKTTSKVFRVLSWIGQFIVWVLAIIYLIGMLL